MSCSVVMRCVVLCCVVMCCVVLCCNVLCYDMLCCDVLCCVLTYSLRREKDDDIKEKLEQLKTSLPRRTLRAVDLAYEKGASSWLTAIPLKDMSLDLSKREFRDALRLRYDRAIPDSPSVCLCGCDLNFQRHNEIRDLEAELLDMVCHDVAVEPTLQPLTEEELNSGANTACTGRSSRCTLSRILGETTDRLFRYTGMSPECGHVQRSYPKPSLQTARRRKEAKICVPGFRSRTRHIHAFGFYDYRRDVR